MAPLLLTALPHDCLASIAALVPTRSWPHLRATCRDLRAAVRDATNGLVIDLRQVPFFPTTPPSTSSPSPSPPPPSPPALPADRALLSRVREVRLLLHKDRDEASLTAEGLGEAAACPVAPLLREIGRAQSAAAAADAAADAADGGARRRPPPLRVSLCVRAPRSVVAACVPRWLRDSGIAGMVNGTVDVRADGALLLRPPGGSMSPREREPESEHEDSRGDRGGDEEEFSGRGQQRWQRSASVAGRAGRRGSPCPPSSWGGFPPECRFSVEMKFAGGPRGTSALEASVDLLREMAGARRVASLSVLSMSAALRSPAGALSPGLRSFRALAETLEELRLGESVPAPFVRGMLLLRGASSLWDVEPGLCWPALRRMVLLGSPAGAGAGGDDDPGDSGGPWRCSRRSAGGGGEEEEPLDPFPSLETLAVKREHAQGWLRRFGDAIDPARVTVERL